MIQQKHNLFESYLDCYNFILLNMQRNRISPAYAETIMLHNNEIELYLNHISGMGCPIDTKIRNINDWEDVIEIFTNNLNLL